MGHGAQGEADAVPGKSLASPCNVDWLDVLFGWRRSGCPLGSRWSCLLAPGLLLQDLRDLGFEGVQVVGQGEDPGLLGFDLGHLGLNAGLLGGAHLFVVIYWLMGSGSLNLIQNYSYQRNP